MRESLRTLKRTSKRLIRRSQLFVSESLLIAQRWMTRTVSLMTA